MIKKYVEVQFILLLWPSGWFISSSYSPAVSCLASLDYMIAANISLYICKFITQLKSVWVIDGVGSLRSCLCSAQSSSLIATLTLPRALTAESWATRVLHRRMFCANFCNGPLPFIWDKYNKPDFYLCISHSTTLTLMVFVDKSVAPYGSWCPQSVFLRKYANIMTLWETHWESLMKYLLIPSLLSCSFIN